MRSRKTIAAVAATLACWSGVCTAAMPTPATADAGTCQPGEQSSLNAELFTTENTATITDPDASQLNDGLELFELQTDATAVTIDVLNIDIAHRLVEEAGRDWHTATIAYGKREFAA